MYGEHRLMVFENRMLRKLSRLKWDVIIGGWREMHSEELHNKYSSCSIIIMIKLKWMRWAWYVARLGEKRNACRIMVGKAEGKRPLGKPGRRR
jgi:hypothetical protein